MKLRKPSTSLFLSLAVFAGSAMTASAQIPEPLLYYDFEEGAGGTVNDDSVNGHDGTIIGNVTFTAGAPIGPTPGSGGRFSVGGAGHVAAPSLDWPSLIHGDGSGGAGNGDYTLACWLNPTANSIGGDHFIWGQGNQGVHHGLRGSGTLHFAHWGADFNATMILTAGEWVHALWTYDAATDLATMYLNGMQDGQMNERAPNGGGTFILGGRNGGTQNFEGDLDDVAVWTVVLGNQDILDLAGGASPIGASRVDDDNDGLPDGYEQRLTDPDGAGPLEGNITDLDGLASGPGPGAGTGDFDGDGLTDLEEFEGPPRTDPTSADSDGDGLADGVETNTGTWNGVGDTGTSAADADSDNDGLDDGVENPDEAFVDADQPGTDPNKSDSDGDGHADLAEINNGFDPTNDQSFPLTPINLGTGTGSLLNNDATFPLRDLTDPENDGDPEADVGYDAIFDSSEEMGFGGGEFAYNVFDNQLGPGNGKWCCGNAGFPYWVQATVPVAHTLTNFTVSSANDVPTRDPTVWEIQGSSDGISFDTIFRQDDPAMQLWGPRFEVLRFDAGVHYPFPPAYTTFRFMCEATMLTSGAMFQVGEIEFFGTPGGRDFQITVLDPADDQSVVDMEFGPTFAGQTYAVEVSRNLIDWIELDDGVPGSDPVTEYTDAFPPVQDENDPRPVYYRVKQNQ